MPDAADAVWLDVLPSFRNFGSELAKGAGAAAEKEGASTGKKFGTAMLVGVGAVAGGAVVAGKALYNLGATFDDMADTIRVGTGATGKDLDGLVQSAKNVGKNVPASFEDIGTTVADLNTRMGLTGPTVEKVAAQFLELGRITGEKVDIGKTTAAFNQFGIKGEQTSGALDKLYTVSQATGIGVNDLVQKVTAAGPAMQTLGFSFDQTAGLIGTLDKAGLNSNATMAAMQKSLVTLAKEGEKPQDAFKRVVGEIQGFVKNGDEAAALNLAGKVFGTRGAAQFIGAIKSGALNLKTLGTVTGETQDSILGAAEDTADFAEQWELFKNRVLLVVEPLATKLFSAIGSGMQWINDNAVPAVQRFVDEWERGVGAGGRLRDAVAGVGQAIMSGLRFVWEYRTALIAVGAAVGTLVGVGRTIQAVSAAQKAVTDAGGLLRYAQSINLVKSATAAWTAATKLLNLAFVASPWGWVILAIGAVVAGVIYAYQHFEGFRNVVNAVGSAITGAFKVAIDWVVNTAWPAIKGFFGMLGSAASDGSAGVQSGLGKVREFLQPLIDWFTGFVIPRFREVGAALAESFRSMSEVVRPILQAIGDFIMLNIRAIGAVFAWLWTNAIGPFVTNFVTGLQVLWGFVQPILMAIGQLIWDQLVNAFNTVVAVAQAMWNGVVSLFQIGVGIVKNVIELFLNLLTGHWSEAGQNVQNIVRGMADFVWTYLQTILNVVMAYLGGVWNFIVTGFTFLKDAVVGAVTMLANLVVAVFRWLVDTNVAILQGFMAAAVGVWNLLKDLVIGTVHFLVTSVVNSFTWWRDTVVSIATTAKDWIVDRFTQLKDGAMSLFQMMVDGIGRIWDGLKRVAAAPVRFVIDTVINDGIIKGWNSLIDMLHLDGKLKVGTVNVGGFAVGGYTGDGDTYEPAGVVHRGEYVIRKKATRQIMRDYGPGFLDVMNRQGIVPGHASGGLVGGSGSFSPIFEQHLLAAQAKAGQQFSIFQRGFRPATSYSGTSHQGDAIDLGPVNLGVVAALRSEGIAAWDRTGKGNWAPHIHGVPLPGVGMGAGSAVWQANDYLSGGDGLGGRDNGPRGGAIAEIIANAAKYAGTGGGSLVDMAGAWIADKLGSPVRALLNKIPGAGAFVDLAKGVGTKLLDSALEKIKSIGSWFGSSSDPGGSGVERWRPLVAQALGITRLGGGPADENLWLKQIQTESSGNPNLVQSSAVNDINVQRGDPARGLVQVPGVTWADFGRDMGSFIPNVYDPLKNLIVGMRAVQGQYVNRGRDWRAVIGHGHGYARGTNSAHPGLRWVGERGPELIDFSGREQVFDAKDSKAIASRGGNQYVFSPNLLPTNDVQRDFETFAHEVRRAAL